MLQPKRNFTLPFSRTPNVGRLVIMWVKHFLITLRVCGVVSAVKGDAAVLGMEQWPGSESRCSGVQLLHLQSSFEVTVTLLDYGCGQTVGLAAPWEGMFNRVISQVCFFSFGVKKEREAKEWGFTATIFCWEMCLRSSVRVLILIM